MANLVKVSTYQGMTAMVNPDNPSFSNFLRGRAKSRFIEVYAIVSDGTKQWREQFKVSSMKVAEEQVKEVLQFFNDTRRPEPPVEKERHFVSLYIEEPEVARYEDDYGMSGWLDPEGVFHPCGFGRHVEYVLELLNSDLDAPFKSAHSGEIMEFAENQHIPMSNTEQSSGAFISILGDLTPPQVEWFNLFFFKLSSVQKSAVTKAAKEQGIQLKYDW